MNQISVDGAQPPKTMFASINWPGHRQSTISLPFELALLFGAGVLAAVLHQSFRWPLQMPGYHGIEWLAILAFVRLTSNRPAAGLAAGLGAASAALFFADGSVGLNGKSAQMITYLLQGCVLDALVFRSRVTLQAFVWLPITGALVHMIAPLVRNTLVSLNSGFSFGALVNGVGYPLMTHALFGAVGASLGLLLFIFLQKKTPTR